MKSRHIVAAAMKMDDGLLVMGIRHFSPDMRAVMKRIYGEGYGSKVVEQGFIDQYGVFLDRQEAHTLAVENGQRRYRCGGDANTLYSENLW